MQDSVTGEKRSVCPSAQPEWSGSVAFGVITGEARQPCLEHFVQILPVDAPQLRLVGPISPTEVFRFAAPCLEGRCEHFREQRCGLVQQIVTLLPVVIDKLPPCPVRAQCVWWKQEGRAACERCPQVVTDNYNPSPAMRKAAEPGLNLAPGVVERSE